MKKNKLFSIGEYQELEIDFEYSISVGLRYTFESVDSNVVNPRFGGGKSFSFFKRDRTKLIYTHFKKLIPIFSQIILLKCAFFEGEILEATHTSMPSPDRPEPL